MDWWTVWVQDDDFSLSSTCLPRKVSIIRNVAQKTLTSTARCRSEHTADFPAIQFVVEQDCVFFLHVWCCVHNSRGSFRRRVWPHVLWMFSVWCDFTPTADLPELCCNVSTQTTGDTLTPATFHCSEHRHNGQPGKNTLCLWITQTQDSAVLWNQTLVFNRGRCSLSVSLFRHKMFTFWRKQKKKEITCLTPVFVISFLSQQFSVKIYVPAYILSMHLCKR